MRFILLIVLTVVLSGCGSLHLEVSVLAPKVVEHELDRRLLREQLAVVLGQPGDEAERPIVEVERQHFEFLGALEEAYRRSSERATNPEEQLILDAQIASVDQSMATFRPRYADAMQLMKDIQARVAAHEASLDQAGEEDRARIEAEMARQLRIRAARLASLQREVEDEILESLESSPDEVRSQVAKAGRQAIRTSRASLIAGQGLVQDPLAHTVASSADEAWAPGFNQVLGRGTFGNLNMAIKMEELGDFTLKGLTFDPSDVARVAGKVTTQALILASQIAGVPIATTSTQPGTPATTGQSLATSSKRLAAAESERALAQAKSAAHAEGLFAVAQVVLREWPALESESRRAGGVAAIKSGFAANLPRLKMEGLGPATTDEEGASEEPSEDLGDDNGDDPDEDEVDEDEENEDGEDAEDDAPPQSNAAPLKGAL